MTLKLLLCGLLLALSTPALTARADDFSANPIVYFVVTDRFYNGNPANDRSYGRQPDGEQEIGTFHGGDLAGLTEKLNEGYFRELGVNAIWITPPYEQIHGWVQGANKAFKHYAYHGYYALDYTLLDNNMGSEDELRAFVDTAHAQGIRVIFDVVMNHPGYADPQTLTEYGVNVIWDGWQNATVEDYQSYFNYNDFAFMDWWGPDWVRAGLPGYEEGNSYDDRLMSVAYLPDFKTESDQAVEIPKFLQNKPDTRAVTIPGFTVRDYLVKWLTGWVREYGIDGFRADTAKHVDLESWAALKTAASAALREWKANNPEKKIDDAEFWMVGEVFPHGVERSAYFDHGFDSLINFDFQQSVSGERLDTAALDSVYTHYAQTLHGEPAFNVLSYISSHDTRLFDRDRLIQGGTALMLVPGGVQIFYGDETARPWGLVPGVDELPGPRADSWISTADIPQATRSSMNWDSVDQNVLAHWRTLGQFRRKHPALAAGEHKKLADQPYTFSRVYQDDRVVVAIGASGEVTLTVGDTFADGEQVRDAYTGQTMTVEGGQVSLTVHANGVVLLEPNL